MRINNSPLLLRLKSISIEIRWAFLIALGSILITELILKNYPAANHTVISITEIWLKICYSILAATIFYFLNQHLPKEEKKLKYYRYINNKVISLDDSIKMIISKLNIKSENHYRGISKEILNDACSRINPLSQVVSPTESTSPFENWYEYLNYKAISIKKDIKDLILLNDIVETGLVEKLLIIEDSLKNLFLDRVRFTNTDLTFWASPIFNMTNQSDKAVNILIKKYRRFSKEHSERFNIDAQGNN